MYRAGVAGGSPNKASGQWERCISISKPFESSRCVFVRDALPVGRFEVLEARSHLWWIDSVERAIVGGLNRREDVSVSG